MSRRELERGGVLARVKAGDLRIKDAAELMRVSYRQAKRLWKGYRADGAANTVTRGDPAKSGGEVQRLRADTRRRAPGE